MGSSEIKKIQRIYRRKIPPERILTHEFARNISEISRDINRQIGVLVNRKGEIVCVVVGDHKKIVIPEIEGIRSSSTRLAGVRLIHTHLNKEPLTEDDLTDLALLRIDLISAIEVDPDGFPVRTYTAHLIPENPEGKYWLLMEPVRPSDMDINFLHFIQALEEEFARQQKTRRITSNERAILVRVETGSTGGGAESLDELGELAKTSGVEVFDSIIQYRNKYDPKVLLGKGKLADIVIRALQIGANLLIFDHELTPAQIRSITDITDLKVIDRTQLILDIFAKRAHSMEGKIQVELAQLRYLLPRLATKNTAMSRLTGGIGGRGPGETKLEINRRRVRERIARLDREIKNIKKGRSQRREKRKKKELPVISIIGYTNAGKSTLLNALTQSHVLTEDRLFATLDPKSSRLRFPRDRSAIITDTVGFIKNLPKELFDSFRSTLEELGEADLLLHVIDVANINFEDHITAVENILEELDLAKKPCIRVFNKEDLFPDKALLQNLCRRFDATPVSALRRETLLTLMQKIEETIIK